MENQAIHAQRLDQLRELEERKRMRFRSDLLNQIDADKERKHRQQAEDNDFEFVDGEYYSRGCVLTSFRLRIGCLSDAESLRS